MKRKYHQGYDDRLDESLGMRHRGPHKQSLMDRRHESEGEERRMSGHEFAGDREMDRSSRKKHHHMMMEAHHRFMSKHHRRRMGK